MGVRFAGFLVRWKADDRACGGFAGLPRVRGHGYAEGNDRPVDAGATELGRGSVRRRGVCLSWAAGWTHQANLARRSGAVHADQTARAWPVRLAVLEHAGTNHAHLGATGRSAGRMRVAGACTTA